MVKESEAMKRPAEHTKTTMKNKTKFPSVASIRAALALEKRSLRKHFSRADLLTEEGGGAGTDVRLQVYENGSWAIHTGASDYDQDHRGYWGCAFLSYDRENITDIARDLLDQAKDHAAQW